MKSPHLLAASALVALALPAAALAARAVSDLAPPAKRQASVDVAERLAARPAPAPLPAELPSPFNPPDFSKPDPAAAARPAAPGAPAPAEPAIPAAPPGDREILERLAARIPSTGTIKHGGRPLLAISGGKRLEVGTKFVVSYDNQDYELELVAIDSTTFTLRYRGEEFTRPIRSVR